MSDIVSVQRRVSSLDVSPQFDSYSKVVIHVDDNTTFEYGTNTGRTLEFDNPFGSQQMAQDILTRLQGYQYQPYDAGGALLDPAAEIGDALNSPLVYGGIYTRSKTFGRLMKTDVSAPQDEEINHEYEYESPEVREFKRENAELRASLMITNNAITAEVTRATQAEGTLTSQLSAQADQIAAKVSQSGGNSSSFGWTLTASGFSLYSGGTEVMKCDSSGLTVAGNISGISGTIGGFTISSSALYTNNMSSIWSTQSSGVHLSASGIKLGQNFMVDSSGNLTCSNATITGTLNIGGSYITAAQLQQGALSAYNNGGNWNSAYTSTSSGGYCYGAASSWNNAKTTSSSCDYFQATTIVGGTIAGRSGGTLGGSINDQVVIKGYVAQWKQQQVVTTAYLSSFDNPYTGQTNYSLNAGYATIYYLGR